MGVPMPSTGAGVYLWKIFMVFSDGRQSARHLMGELALLRFGGGGLVGRRRVRHRHPRRNS